MKNFYITSILALNFFAQFNFETSLVLKSFEDFLINSNSNAEKLNTLLPFMNSFSKNFYASKNHGHAPFWLRMANQALYLEYNKQKIHKII